MITCLAGGVGAARFLQGLVKFVSEEEVTIIGNTGDDIELYGLNISPDLDIIIYTLAGLADEEKGWGLKGDTFNCLNMLKLYGHETWFNLGDRDIATHIYRTQLLKRGFPLSDVTKRLREKLSLKEEILPMTNDRFETRIRTPNGSIHFQEYLVKRQAQDDVLGVHFEGADKAKPAPGVIDSILKARTVVVCPSNPIVSIGTILSIRGVREALKETQANVAAISPIVGGSPVKGPADKLMRGLGKEVSAFAVARLYQDFIDSFVIDQIDQAEKEKIEGLGLHVVVTDSIMKSLDDKIRLAKAALQSVESL
ncbi:MAG: 2-phospho-L-lactate transferase [Thermoproteota archaeon]|nr:2-phospho-L-lactate transferase [Thermoproteota archaeon]